jgi:antitoxin component YwqK of YwqJK toxin-antitoxin module
MTIRGYKVAYFNGTRVLVTLDIPDYAKTNMHRKSIKNQEYAKYRCNIALVANIEDIHGLGKVFPFAKNRYFTKKTITYYLGTIIKEPLYNTDINVICTSGIHYFLNKEQALHYGLNTINNGTLRKWNDNGELRYICNFVDGKKNGIEKKWFQNNNLESEITYFNNIKHGEFKVYYPNGNLKERGLHYNGMRDGIYRSWFDNGCLESEITYLNGKRITKSKEYYPNGNLRIDSTYISGKLDGSFKVYSSTGKLIKEYVFDNDNMMSKVIYSD